MAIEKDLNLAICSLAIVQEDWQTNLENASAAISGIRDADIIVLPELFSTGFVRDANKAKQLAAQSDDVVKNQLRELAAASKCALSGSMMHFDSDKDALYNQAFFVEPDGEMHVYNKRHLFTLGAEGEVFRAGNKMSPVVRYRGWNVAMVVCYDLRFPVWTRNAGLKYDVLLVPANWPAQRSFAWTHLLQARAIENQAYVAGANRSGEDKMGIYDNQSYIADFMGKFIGESHGNVVRATLSKRDLNSFREKFAFWNDADEFKILGIE